MISNEILFNTNIIYVYHICILSENIKYIARALEKGQKAKHCTYTVFILRFSFGT